MEKRFSSQPTGYLLGKFGLLALLAGLLFAAWYGQVVLVILFGLTLSAAGLARLWSRFSLAGVSCQRLLSERCVFPGEHIELRLRLVNRKLLPLPWVQVDDEIPIGLAPDHSLVPSSRPGFCFLSKGAALLWYTGVKWRHHLCGNKRGYYSLGPMALTSGDIFGFYPRSVILPSIDHVIVYPKIFPITQLGLPSMNPIGESTAERRIFEDPIRVVGVRDYSPHDSRRRIHWKATARHQSLQVKVFEPTTTLKIALFMAVDSFQSRHGEVHNEDDFELSISLAASIANHLIIEQRSSAGIFVNTLMADSGLPVRISPGGSTSQLVEILEALAKVTPLTSQPFEEFFQDERIGLPWGTTLVFILSRPRKALVDLFAGLKESGHKVLVLQVSEEEVNATGHSITWHQVRKPADFMEISAKETK